MKQKNSKLYIAILVLIFLVVVLIGRTFFSGKKTTVEISNTPSGKSQVEQKEESANIVQEESAAEARAQADDQPQVNTPAENLACIEKERAAAKAAADGHAEGTILVGFKTGVSFSDAKNTLALYGMKVQLEAQAKESYPSNRLLTAVVNKGEEFAKICQIRVHANVRYSGINPIFTLHE